MEIIKTTKLTKYYGKARGIIDLDLTVTQGESSLVSSGQTAQENQQQFEPCLD